MNIQSAASTSSPQQPALKRARTTDNLSRLRIIMVYFFTLALIITGFWLFQQHSAQVFRFIQNWGTLAPLMFVLLYVIATLVFLPTMVITLAGGAIFGPVMGTVYNVLGATTGAALAFLISRYLAGDKWRNADNPKLEKLLIGVEQKGWLFLALLRLFPIIPFNLVNYGLGLTRLSFRLYIVATLIFLLPPEIIYTYCGYASQGILSHPELVYQKCLGFITHGVG